MRKCRVENLESFHVLDFDLQKIFLSNRLLFMDPCFVTDPCSKFSLMLPMQENPRKYIIVTSPELFPWPLGWPKCSRPHLWRSFWVAACSRTWGRTWLTLSSRSDCSSPRGPAPRGSWTRGPRRAPDRDRSEPGSWISANKINESLSNGVEWVQLWAN